jgi:CelD/BcsL family acetyltransferase involved in cellulose biosynthesis
MKVECLGDSESLEELKDKWNELLFSSEQNCIFFAHEWISSWWKCFSEDNSLEILVFKDEGGSLAGIAPFMTKGGLDKSSPYNKGRILRFIASEEVSDYCDFITLDGRREEFYENLLSYLKTNYSDIKKIELMNLQSSSPTLNFLPGFAPKYGYSSSCSESEVAPLLELPSSYEDYMKGLSKKCRHELRRKLRRMESLEGVKVTRITDTKELQSSLETFIALHKEGSPSKQRFWEKKGMPAFFLEVASRFSLQKWVELNFLYHEDRIMAALLNFSYSNQIYFYNVAFSKDFARYSPGLFLFNHCIKQAISEGKRKVDFLRGREKYKYYFGAEDSKIFRLELTPRKSE